jgi:hypothetical protein
MSNVSTSMTAAIAVAAATLLTTLPSTGPVPPSVRSAGEVVPQQDTSAATPPVGLAFVDATLPTANTGSDGKIRASVYVKNATDRCLEASLQVTLRSASGSKIIPAKVSGPRVTVPKSASSFGLSLTIIPEAKPSLEDYPLSGWLTLETLQSTGPPPATKSLEIKAISGPNSGNEWVLLRCALLAAAVAVGIAGLTVIWRYRSKGGLKVLLHRMGSPSWSFTDSWSSTITIAGAIVISLLNFAGLPDQGHTLSKKTYGLISLLLAALIGLAPGMYSLFRKPVQAKDAASALVVQYQGIVLLFLVAAMFTMTGVVAQLGLLGVLFEDLCVAGLLSPEAASLFHGLMIALQILLWVYSVLSIVQTIETQSVSSADAEGTQPSRLFLSGTVDSATAATVRHQLPDWPLL